MRNRKGFTLIELLAVIVILAIIMVIAVPQILNVINDSRKSAWTNSIKMIESAIETNTTLFDPSSGAQTYTLTTLCNNPNANLKSIADLGDIWTDDATTGTGNKNIKCAISSGTYTFTFTGKNQFSGRTATISCTAFSNGTNVNCTPNIGTNN